MSPAIVTLVILCLAVVLFVLDVLPMGLVAFLVPLSLYFTGIIEVDDIFASIVNSNVILIIAMCVLGAAFFKTGMAYQTSLMLLKYTKSEKGLTVVVFLISGVMSGFVSNSGTVAVLIPIVLGIAASSKIQPIKLLFPLVFGSTIGADISVIGSPGNLIAKNTIEELSNGEMTVSFFEYAKIGVPLLIVTAIFLYFFSSKLIPNREAVNHTKEELNYDHIPAWQRTVTMVVMVLTVVGMVASDYFDFLPPMHIIASCGAVVLVLSGVLTQKEAFNSFETLTVFMLAFMIPLGAALNDTGAGAMIANAVIAVTGDSGAMVIMASLWLLTWGLTQVMSNTAACTLLCPIGWTIAETIGADPRAVVIAILIGSSVAVCTPMAIPANSMIIGPGNVKFKDFLKPGLAVSAVCFVVSMILLPIFYPFY